MADLTPTGLIPHNSDPASRDAAPDPPLEPHREAPVPPLSERALEVVSAMHEPTAPTEIPSAPIIEPSAGPSTEPGLIRPGRERVRRSRTPKVLERDGPAEGSIECPVCRHANHDGGGCTRIMGGDPDWPAYCACDRSPGL